MLIYIYISINISQSLLWDAGKLNIDHYKVSDKFWNIQVKNY